MIEKPLDLSDLEDFEKLDSDFQKEIEEIKCRIKSAVQGLVADVENTKFATSKHLQDETRKEVKKLIKRWFPGMVERRERGKPI